MEKEQLQFALTITSLYQIWGFEGGRLLQRITSASKAVFNYRNVTHLACEQWCLFG